MTERFAGRTCVVTGAAQGIGRRVAERFGAEGADVAIADVHAESAEAAAAELREAGTDALAIECDVSSVADTERLAEQVVEQFGTVDVLVNNAGVSTHGTFTDLEPAEWNEVLDVNLTGAFYCARALVPEMIEQGDGRIVNVSSMAGRNISYHAAANYTASKWGLVGLTKHMAWDLGDRGIRVTAVCPGSTLTPLTRAATTDDDRAETAGKIPLNRWATPDDVADGVLYLASDEAAYVTGTVLEIDGGKQLGVRHDL